MARAAFLYREEGLAHDTGPGHPERADRLRAIHSAFTAAGIEPSDIEIAPATRDDLLRVHTSNHIFAIKETCAKGLPYPDADTVMCAASWDAALVAAGGAIAACKAVLDGDVDRAFSAMRPPGHHAEAGHAMGFCLFNNIAITARWLREVGEVERVAIVDWDVHHGNGTQHSTYDDPSIYYASLHQWPLYPGTGRPEERGAENTNLNCTMAAGSGPDEWLEALDNQVLPELERFDPQFLLMSAGFDAHRLDPLADCNLETDTFADITRKLTPFADGKVVSLLEGGYHLDALAASALAHFKALQE